LVVLGVRHDLEDKDLLAPVKYSSDEAILVAANVKHDAVADEAGTPIDRDNISP